MKAPHFAIVVDTREQNPLEFPAKVPVIFGALGEGDYAVSADPPGHFERFGRIERKSFADLWKTVHQDADRFARERCRLGDVPRAVLLVDDVFSLEQGLDAMGASDMQRGRLRKILRTIQWKARLPIVFAGTRARAASYVIEVLATVVHDYAPERVARADELARVAGPCSSLAQARQSALLAAAGRCAVCARSLPERPKVVVPGVCACGRKAKAA